MNQKKRAWIYCRIDAPEDTHGTLKGQRQQLMDYADQMGFTVVGSSEDLANGFSFDRLGLSRLTKAAESGTVDVLLVYNVSRIGRDTCQTMAFLERIARAGITVYSPLEGKLSFSFQKMVADAMMHSGIDQQKKEDGDGTEKGNQGNVL